MVGVRKNGRIQVAYLQGQEALGEDLVDELLWVLLVVGLRPTDVGDINNIEEASWKRLVRWSMGTCL